MNLENEIFIFGKLKLNPFKNEPIRFYYQPREIDKAESLTTDKPENCEFYIDLEIVSLVRSDKK